MEAKGNLLFDVNNDTIEGTYWFISFKWLVGHFYSSHLLSWCVAFDIGVFLVSNCIRNMKGRQPVEGHIDNPLVPNEILHRCHHLHEKQLKNE